MCITYIPNFKEVFIMYLTCEECGYRSNEIKGGGGIPRFEPNITLRVKTKDYLAREVLNYDMAGIWIPILSPKWTPPPSITP